MTRINLYPWRVEFEARQKKQFFIILGVTCALTILLMIILSSSYSWAINNQTENNDYLNKEIVEMSRQLREIDELKSQKDALITRLAVIQQIEHDRYHTLNLFNEIVNLINPLIVLKSIKRTENLVKLNGVAESNAEVAKFLRAIEMSSYFSNAQLDQIKVDEPVADPIAKANLNTNSNTSVNQLKLNNTNNIIKAVDQAQVGLTHFFELQFNQNHSNINIDQGSENKALESQVPVKPDASIEQGKNV